MNKDCRRKKKVGDLKATSLTNPRPIQIVKVHYLRTWSAGVRNATLFLKPIKTLQTFKNDIFKQKKTKGH